ncbi:MAG: methyltransferase [Candidatus Hydrogenedentes bacterium]|nr:methyltransferase [Candidatus Hydrogenedentota bacterium]
MVKQLLSLPVIVGSLLAAPAFAAIDTTDALASITDAGTAIAAVGGGILVLAGISLGYRWVKATFF